MTSEQREKGQFLTDGQESRLPEYSAFPNEGTNPQYRYRIRERTKGVLDQLGLVGRHLPPKDIKKIFTQYHPEPDSDNRMIHFPDVASEIGNVTPKERVVVDAPNKVRQFRRDTRDTLFFLFHGIMETPSVDGTDPVKAKNEYGEKTVPLASPQNEFWEPDIDFSLEQLITEAVERAAEQRGKRVEKCTVEIELGEPEEITSLKERLEQGEPLDYEEKLRLIHESDVTGKEIQEYHDRTRSEGEVDVGFGPPEEVRDALDSDDE